LALNGIGKLLMTAENSNEEAPASEEEAGKKSKKSSRLN
jgi:hypothetical protein